jgi:adenine-specific DNA glycosylase
VGGFGAVVKEAVDPDCDVRPIDALAEVTWQPTGAQHDAPKDKSEKKSKKAKKDKKRRVESEE